MTTLKCLQNFPAIQYCNFCNASVSLFHIWVTAIPVGVAPWPIWK